MKQHSDRVSTQVDQKEGMILINAEGLVEQLNGKAESLLQIKGHPLHIENLFLDFPLGELETCEKGTVIQRYIKPADRPPFPVFLVVHPISISERDCYIITIQNLVQRSHLDHQFYEPLKELIDVKYALDESSIVALTDQRGVIRYANKKFCEVSKYSLEEIIGKDHRILNSGHHSKAFFKNLWRTIGFGEVWKGEIKNRAKDGSYYWVDTTIVPFLKENGKPYQYLAIRNEITERKRVEQELQHMMTRFVDVQEEEKRKFSRELHDGVGQELYSLLISVHRLMQDVDHPLLEQLEADTSGLIQSVREMSWELRPPALDELGLLPAVRSFVNRMDNSYDIRVHLYADYSYRLSNDVETTIYRVIQEALTNVRKYAQVTEAVVSIKETSDSIQLSIIDEGVGIREDERRKGVGLFSMEERARSVGGTLCVTSPLNGGTKVELEIPKLR
ncbi:PAS domain-containing sensor histidine kinase [Halobacillus salinus]|uniref:PAS domain-containing sensor histidine kinase n=1 Tax=Halobacillus salinus TaxID=192814 RepID=UPI0009A65B18|nr:PAS domain-containing sensor histidine kinase [Halobacillus salinus]